MGEHALRMMAPVAHRMLAAAVLACADFIFASSTGRTRLSLCCVQRKCGVCGHVAPHTPKADYRVRQTCRFARRPLSGAAVHGTLSLRNRVIHTFQTTL